MKNVTVIQIIHIKLVIFNRVGLLNRFDILSKQIFFSYEMCRLWKSTMQLQKAMQDKYLTPN